MGKLVRMAMAGSIVIAAIGSPHAEPEVVFTIEFEDGKITPLRLEVPSNQRFKIELRNNGRSAAEFESDALRKEKVLAPGAQSFVVFKSLDPGEYEFVDEFHPEAPKGTIVAK
jgi:hypothetical protein